VWLTASRGGAGSVIDFWTRRRGWRPDFAKCA
jgi:hypothetical protein